jgi:hypothetical protein
MEVLCFVDTGADISVIPASVASRLELRQTAVAEVSGLELRPARHPLFRVLMALPHKNEILAETIAWDEEYALLGRDLLNRWEITLNGPARIMNIA